MDVEHLYGRMEKFLRDNLRIPKRMVKDLFIIFQGNMHMGYGHKTITYLFKR